MDADADDLLRTRRAHVRRLLDDGRHDLAEPIVRQILALAPDDPEAVRQLASCLTRRLALDEALPVARRAVSLAPGSAQVHVTLSFVHDRRGEPEPAIACCLEALRLRLRAVEVHSHLADLSLQLRRFADAIDWTAAGLAVVPTHVGLLRSRAIALAGLGRSEEAVAVIDDLLRLDPDGAMTHASVGNALKLLRRFDAAADHLLVALARNPTHPRLHEILGEIRLGQRQPAEAARHFDDALRIQPGRRPATVGLRRAEVRPIWDEATAARQAKDYPRAEGLLRQVLEIDPDHAVAMADLARTLLMLRRFDEAVAAGIDAVRLRPASPIARYNLGNALIAVERFDDALGHGREGMRLKSDSPLHYQVPAESLIELGRHGEALAVLDAGMALGRDSPSLPKLRAVALAGAGRVAEALDATAAFLSRAPAADASVANRRAGEVHLLLRQWSAAEAHFRQALSPDATRGSTGHLGVGLALAAQGDAPGAKLWLDEAVRLNPWSGRAKAARGSVLACSEPSQ